MSPGQSARLIELARGKELRTFALPDEAESIRSRLSADGERVAIAYREPRWSERSLAPLGREGEPTAFDRPAAPRRSCDSLRS